ncbi:MAG: heme lyase CcmF/NrfE family subunit [Nitrospirae bacterium]|nr:heme lyase CcmF/NrfE family subunit [Nitrospirota bacterium]MBI3594207.1 heme lyase CcmF/NrfE family subunit [Nitrospirota bacterium]
MIIEIGHLAVIAALVLAILGIIAPLVGIRKEKGVWIEIGRQAVTVNFVLLSIGMAAMIYSYITQDYSVKYVWATSNSKLPFFYKVAGLWGGHEGSLLLWSWILSFYCMAAVWIHWKTQPVVIPYLIAMESLILSGFLLLILFLSNPFERIFPAPSDGRDLNPLLQDPAMVGHPPMLYLGYVGLSIPFCFAMAALFSGRLGEEWIKVTQRWTLLAWMALTTGILMGGYWAYYELGWGGYWGWDPVENAAFMPWLIATAFLHSVMVQETRKMFKVWNLFLIILAFSLSLIGTFLVRSGVLSSVHSFAADPGRGVFILGFLSSMLLLSFGTLIFRSAKLKSLVLMDSMVSRESVFLFNNLFFLVAMITVFIGTLYPLLTEALKLKKVSVGPPYYNAVFMPVALGLIFLMGVGPYISWRKVTRDNLRSHFVIPLLIAGSGLVLSYIGGIHDLYALSGLTVVIFALTSILLDFSKVSRFWARQRKINPFQGFYAAFRQNPRRYAGILTHIGVLVMVVGIIFSTIYQTEKVVVLKPGESVTLNAFRIELIRLYEAVGPNWVAQEGAFNLYENNILISEMRPQKRIYTVTQTPTTETALHQIYMGHVFLTIPEVAPDGSWARVRALYNPLVLWVWYGGGIMVLGGLLNIFRPRRKEVYSFHSSSSPSAAEPISPLPQLSSKRVSPEP